jgi:hypothetical protein
MNKLALFVGVLSLSSFFGFISGDTRVIKATEWLDEPYHANVECKIKDDAKYECLPAECSRHVIDGVFEESDITALHSIAEKGMNSRGPSLGGPTILDINTGFVRDSNGLENLFTRDVAGKIFSDDDFALYGRIIAKLKETVMAHMKVDELHFTAPTFITRLDGASEWKPTQVRILFYHSSFFSCS